MMLFRRILAMMAWWRAINERRRQRIALGQLDERMLRDIGIRSYDAACEARKPFWR